jgi:APA family basic amino acid/polyamine antiporter
MDLAAIAMRIREPDLPRPFRMPLFPIPAVAGFCMNALLVGAMAYEDPFDSSLGVGLVIVIGIAMKVRTYLTVRRAAAV